LPILHVACVAGLYSKPQCFDYEHARKEFEVTCFSAIRDLMNKTGVQPRQIGIVITNSSLFNPTPSLSATIMNHFKMPHTTFNYNLGGMGCSAGGRQALAQLQQPQPVS
jgi:3-ketoacyl-CoA synthase